jgi:hypothetical protein
VTEDHVRELERSGIGYESEEHEAPTPRHTLTSRASWLAVGCGGSYTSREAPWWRLPA